jgi:hypothetical protein
VCDGETARLEAEVSLTHQEVIVRSTALSDPQSFAVAVDVESALAFFEAGAGLCRALLESRRARRGKSEP